MCILLLDMYVFYECWLDLCWEYCVLYFFFIFLSNFLSLCERRILTFNYTCGIFFLSFQFYQLFSFHRFCSQVVSYLGFLCLTVAAAAAKSLQSCLTLCDPIDCSLPGSTYLGFFRQEHWSGLQFPSPVHESEKWKWSCSVVSDSLWPHGLQPTRLLRPWDFPGKSTGVECHCLLCYILLVDGYSY